MATKRTSPSADASASPSAAVPTRANRPFAVRRSAIQGRGVFATRDIEKGERLIEYIGEKISRDEGDLRYDDDAMDRPHTFLFTLDDESAIDGNVRGNDSRYINHSCGPNAESVIENGHIYIDATKRIASGTEITYDYHLVRPGRFKAEWRVRYACRCGARNCRGMLLELPKTRAKGAAKKGAKSGAKKAGKSAAKKSTKSGVKKSAKSGAKARGKAAVTKRPATTKKAAASKKSTTAKKATAKKAVAPKKAVKKAVKKAAGR